MTKDRDVSLLDSNSTNLHSPTLIEAHQTVSARHPHDVPRVSETPTGMSDEQREQAICRASALVEFFHAESRLYEALWRAHSDFGHKAAYDMAYSNAHKAREIMESLIKGRSAAYVAFLEKQRGLDLPACANEGQA